MANRRPQLRADRAVRLAEEAAAIVAALERFMRDTAPRLAPARESPGPVARAAILEGVDARPSRTERFAADPWINT